MFETLSYALLNAFISSLSAFIIYIVLTKKAEKTIKLKEKEYKEALEAWLNSEKGAKALYGVGLLVASGAKQSLGLSNRGGKLKWQDLLMQIGANWAKNNLVPGLNLGSGSVSNVSPQKTQVINSKREILPKA